MAKEFAVVRVYDWAYQSYGYYYLSWPPRAPITGSVVFMTEDEAYASSYCESRNRESGQC